MNLTAWLDVAIGLSIVYLGASLFVTIISEYISQVLNLRGRVLWDSVQELFSSSELKRKLQKNPALRVFFVGGADDKDEGWARILHLFSSRRSKAPSYVDPVVVARALLRSEGGAGARAGIAEIPPDLRDLVRAVGAKTSEIVDAVSHWVDSSLSALGAQYKIYTRWIALGISVCVAVALNIDTVALTALLYKDKEARDAAVSIAVDVMAKTDKAALDRCLKMDVKGRQADSECLEVDELVDAVRLRNSSLAKLPIGWPVVPYGETGAPDLLAQADHWWGWLIRVAGWLLTALALSLGAPFWFDTLGKFMNLRSGVRRPSVRLELASDSREQGSEADTTLAPPVATKATGA